MIYDLPLNPPMAILSRNDIEANRLIKDQLESITDFEKKLTYFNNNVCSLSLFTMEGHIYYEWGNPDQRIYVYCGCTNCRKKTDFKPRNETIFFKLRDKEVKRIVKDLAKAKTYKEKLRCLFSTKGYTPDITALIYENVPFDPSKDADQAMFLSTPVIDLRPVNLEERIAYNEFVKSAFDLKFKDGKGFTKEYNYFDFEKEKERLNRTLNNSLDKANLVNYLRMKIEKHFNYPDCFNDEEDKNSIAKEITQQLIGMGGWLGSNLFPKMVSGIEIDLDRTVMNEAELLRYIHVSQIVKFYNYLLTWREQKSFYIKHPEGLDLLRIPNEILKQYEYLAEYEYIEIMGYGEIPLPRFALLSAKRDNIELTEPCMQAYAKGFIEGYNNNLTPFVDTTKSKMEMIFIEIKGKGGRGFKTHMGNTKNYIRPNDMFDSGLFEGKRYKAWSYIFETPAAFIELFTAEQISSDTMEIKLPIPTYALFHVYLAMFGGKAVTQQNKNELAAFYGYKSGSQLRNDFTNFQNEEKRLDLNTTNKRAAKTHLDRFRIILPLLKKENDKAFQKANEDFTTLENLYNKHY